MHIQKILGSDIAMCFDQCPPGDATADVQEVALERTTRWAARCRTAERAPGQALFGIVQGGIDTARRLRHLEAMTKLDFDGHARRLPGPVDGKGGFAVQASVGGE